MSSRKIEFAPLTQERVAACEEFNDRLRAGGFEGKFECCTNRDRGESPPGPKEVDRYVALDADGHVRGAYLLRWQSLWLRGEKIRAASYGCPISEGVIDRQYAMVGVAVLRDAIQRCEYLYLLGGGGKSGSVFRLGQHLGWQLQDVPFLFRVLRGGRLIARLPQTQRRSERRRLAALGEATGLSHLITGLVQAGSAARFGGSLSLRQRKAVTVEEVKALADAADEIWDRVRSQYAFCVVRDGAHVEASFPADRAGLYRLVVRSNGTIVGWCVVMTKGLSRLRSFLGDVACGLIVDAFGDPEYSTEVVRAATAYLADQGVDVAITNASHHSWIRGYRRTGFLTWRSQFPLVVSQSLAKRIGDLAAVMPHAHLSRADGDGVYYLH